MYFLVSFGFGVFILKKIRVQEGSSVLIFSRPNGLLRVTQYSSLGKKCQNTLYSASTEKGPLTLRFHNACILDSGGKVTQDHQNGFQLMTKEEYWVTMKIVQTLKSYLRQLLETLHS